MEVSFSFSQRAATRGLQILKRFPMIPETNRSWAVRQAFWRDLARRNNEGTCSGHARWVQAHRAKTLYPSGPRVFFPHGGSTRESMKLESSRLVQVPRKLPVGAHTKSFVQRLRDPGGASRKLHRRITTVCHDREKSSSACNTPLPRLGSPRIGVARLSGASRKNRTACGGE